VLGAFRHLFRLARKPVPTVALTIRSRIPLARGLGSSAAAIVAGLVLANHWMKGRFDDEDIFREARHLEGHPDNVAPAIFGGLTLSLPLHDGRVEALKASDAARLGITLAVPSIQVSTRRARALLPKTIPLRRAVETTARGHGPGAHSRDPSLRTLAEALRDVYHVPYARG